MAAAISSILLTCLWIYLILVTPHRLFWMHILRGSIAWKRTQQAKSNRNTNTMSQHLVIKPFMHALERLRLFDTLQLPLSGYHTKLLILNGHGWTMERTKAEAAVSVGTGYMAMTGCAWVSVLGDEPLLLAIGLVLGAILTIRPMIEASRQVERRKSQIIMELPDLLNKLMLQVGAGETVQRAFARCLEGKERESHPLYKEWSMAVILLQNGQSFSTSLERFSRSCAIQEISIFTTVLLLNYRRGGEHFVLALRELSYAMWEKRKSIAKSKGEEASSKLVFPLVGILLVLMVLVAAPALLLMS